MRLARAFDRTQYFKSYHSELMSIQSSVLVHVRQVPYFSKTFQWQGRIHQNFFNLLENLNYNLKFCVKNFNTYLEAR